MIPWTEKEVTEFAHRPEGQFLEKKSCWERTATGKKRVRKAKEVAKDVAKTLSAMANADGGTLLLGVEEDEEITGMDYPQDKLQTILDAPKNLVRPPLVFRAAEGAIKGKKVHIFEVDWSPEVYQLTDGRYLLRIGASNMPFSAEDILQLKQGKRRALYERTFVPTASLSDLDENLIEEFAQKMRLEGKRSEILSHYQLVDVYDGRLQITLAALLLFGKDPLRWHPRCGIDFVKYEGSNRKYGAELNVVKRIRLEYPLVQLVEEAYKTVSAYIRERTVLHDLFFQEHFEYPAFAWQEAIVNAVAHRDYSLQGLSIEIWMFDDRIEIRSPGQLVEPVTLDRLLKLERIHASRNPLIVRILTDMGYMRELGEGIPRMFKEMERQGLYPPDLRIEAESIFSVVLKNTPVYSPETILWLDQFKDLGLTGNQKRLLVWAKEHGGVFTSRNYQKLVKADIYTAAKDIRDLLQKGIARHQGKGSRIYRLIEGKEEVKQVPEDLKKLFPFFKEKGYVKNADIQRLLGVPWWKASRQLNKWVSMSYLKLIGKGRGAIYKPTEKIEI